METIRTPSPKDTVLALRERAQQSLAFNAMAHVFALRERTRQQITLTTLFTVMMKEGFKYSKADYAKELEFMANLGIGKLERGPKGQIRALKGIRVTLQSIGLAAAAKKNSLDRATLVPTFTDLPVIQEVVRKTPPKVEKSDFAEKTMKVSLVIEVDGRKVDMLVASNMDTVKLINLLNKLQINIQEGL